MKAKYSCVLFDLDNTLIDTAPLVREALACCGCAGAAALSESDLRCTSPHELLARLDRPEATKEYWRHYKKLVRHKVNLMDPDAAAVLGQLQTRQVRLGLVTSSIKEVVNSALAKCGLSAFFSRCLVTYGTCPRRKPHPDPINCALRLLEHGADETIYIGDSENDALACRNAGVHFGLAAWAFPEKPRIACRVPMTVLRRLSDMLAYT
jgi:pyrophosphatase PpaX